MSVNPKTTKLGPLLNSVTASVQKATRLYADSVRDIDDTYFGVKSPGGDGQKVLANQLVAAFHVPGSSDLAQVVSSLAGVSGKALRLRNLSSMYEVLADTELDATQAEEWVSGLVDEKMTIFGESMMPSDTNASDGMPEKFTMVTVGTVNYPVINKLPHIVGTRMEFYSVRPTKSKTEVQGEMARAHSGGAVGKRQHMVTVKPMSRRSLARFFERHMTVYTGKPALFIAVHNNSVVPTAVAAGAYQITQMMKTAFVNGLYTLLDTTGMTLVPRGDLPVANRWNVQRPQRQADPNRDIDAGGNFVLAAQDDETNAAYRRLFYKNNLLNGAPNDANPIVHNRCIEPFDIAVVVGASLNIFGPTETPGPYQQRFNGQVWTSRKHGGKDPGTAILHRTDTTLNPAHQSLAKAIRQFDHDITHSIMGGVMRTKEYDFGIMWDNGVYKHSIAKIFYELEEEPDRASEFGRLLEAQTLNLGMGFLGFVNFLMARTKNSAGFLLKNTDVARNGWLLANLAGKMVI